MIHKQRQLFYFVGQTPFVNLADAQMHDLIQMEPQDWSEEIRTAIAAWLLENATEVVDILTTTPRSRLNARKRHGAKPKSRKAKLVQPAKAPDPELDLAAK